MQARGEITRLLMDASAGGEAARERLLAAVYDELRGMAHAQLMHEHGARTLSTTALVHESYLKLAAGRDLPADSRAHFFAAAARAMRQVLVDLARRRSAIKRGQEQDRVTLKSCDLSVEDRATELIALDAALQRLALLEPRLSDVVECRFFGGLSVAEAAATLQTSERTIKRDWRKAKAWLYHELGGAEVAAS